MTAESVARAVADWRRGRVAYPPGRSAADYPPTDQAIVVDLTPLRASLIANRTVVNQWDQCLAPTLMDGVYCWVEPPRDGRDEGAVGLFHRVSSLHDGSELWEPGERDDGAFVAVDWATVRWVTEGYLYVATPGQPEPVAGPALWCREALDADGVPLDLVVSDPWTEAAPDPDASFENEQRLTAAAVNFLNARNVELVEPVRSRAERRRLERTGVTVHEISVFPVSRTTASKGARPAGGGVPLVSVRGHFATYGADGRGLLFGRLAGRFWIPQHARGSAELGAPEQRYTLEP